MGDWVRKWINRALCFPSWLNITQRWRRFYFGHRIKYLGKGVRFGKGVIILWPKSVSIGDYCIIDHYVILDGGKGLELGHHTRVRSFCHLQGGTGLKIAEWVGIASGAKVFSDTHHYTKRLNPYGSSEDCIVGSPVVIEKDVFIGINCVIMPSVHIGEGAVIGANSFVNKDVPAWKIVAGSPAKVIGERPKIQDTK